LEKIDRMRAGRAAGFAAVMHLETGGAAAATGDENAER
jgi:hypothetical protein